MKSISITHYTYRKNFLGKIFRGEVRADRRHWTYCYECLPKECSKQGIALKPWEPTEKFDAHVVVDLPYWARDIPPALSHHKSAPVLFIAEETPIQYHVHNKRNWKNFDLVLSHSKRCSDNGFAAFCPISTDHAPHEAIKRIPFRERSFCVMFASNHYFGPLTSRGPRKYDLPVIREMYRGYNISRSDLKIILGIDARLTGRLRRRFAQELSMCSETDVFGAGWRREKPHSQSILSKDHHYAAARGVYEGSKLEKIGRYKFAIAVENYIADGYVTEKLIDCFMARVVPIYVGGCLDASIFPRTSYLALSDFPSIKDLLSHCREMTEGAWKSYVEAGTAVLESSAFRRTYSAKAFTDRIVREVRALV